MDTSPLSPVRRLRIIAISAIVCAAFVWFAASQHWWHDTSALTGDRLQSAVDAAPDASARACLLQGGASINGPCAIWDVTYPALGMASEASNTIDVTGAAVINTDAPSSMMGLPSAAVFAIAAFGLVAAAAALRSLIASVAALVFGAQAFRALSSLAEMINQPVEGLPELQTTMWYSLFQQVSAIGLIALGGSVLAWVITERSRERRQRIADGTYMPLGDRLRSIATAAVKSAASSSASK